MRVGFGKVKQHYMQFIFFKGMAWIFSGITLVEICLHMSAC